MANTGFQQVEETKQGELRGGFALPNEPLWLSRPCPVPLLAATTTSARPSYPQAGLPSHHLTGVVLYEVPVGYGVVLLESCQRRHGGCNRGKQGRGSHHTGEQA